MTKKKKIIIGIISLTLVLIVVFGSIYFGGYMNTNNLLGYSALSEQSLTSNLRAYMKITETNQDVIKGGCTVNGKEGMHVICDAEHTLSLPSSIRNSSISTIDFSPYIVTTFVSQGLPLLYKASLSGEILTVEIQYYGINVNGQEILYYTVKLENAQISTIDFEKQSTTNGNDEKYQDKVNISFNYGTITWRYEPENIQVSYNVEKNTFN